MKKYQILAFVLGAVVMSGATSPALSQRAPVPADIQKDYDQFIAKFRDALKANDGAAVTEMTKFPFYWNEMRDADYFRKNLYAEIFTSKARACIARAKGFYDRSPQGDENFSIFCGEDLYLFTRTPSGFRFIEAGTKGG